MQDGNIIEKLEKANRELEKEKMSMKAQVRYSSQLVKFFCLTSIQIDSLEMKHSIAVRDKDSAAASAKALQKRLDEVQSHDEQWDTLRRACAQMTELSSMMGQTDTRELQELREVRDRAKVLEGEHAALKRRFKEQDGKMANAEKIAFTARQSLTQAQQRASECRSFPHQPRPTSGLTASSTSNLRSASSALSTTSAHTSVSASISELRTTSHCTRTR